MGQLLDVANDHQARRIRLAQVTANRARAVWAQADLANLDLSWDRLAPRVGAVIAAGQVTAARQSARYLNSVAAVSGFDAESAALVPEAFGGVMLDGREVAPAAFGAVTTTKTAIGAGFAPEMAFQSGLAFLSIIAKAAVTDMGRQADNTLATGKGWTHYVRAVSPGACSRCAILAGKSSLREPFRRHPACKCTAVPIEGDDAAPVPAGLYESPGDYFESLTPAEQERVFTKSGAYAIRNGADPISVVNARRGALSGGGLNGSPSRLVKTTIGVKADGSPLQVYLTGEGTTVRGNFGRREVAMSQDSTKAGRYRRTTKLRLMPEQIQIMAGDNPERARELLQRYGYLR